MNIYKKFINKIFAYGIVDGMVKTIEEIKQCPACGSDNLVYAISKEQIICRDCGLVHEPFSSVAKDILEITQPAENAPSALERVTVKPPRPAKLKPAKHRLKPKTAPKLKAQKSLRKKIFGSQKQRFCGIKKSAPKAKKAKTAKKVAVKKSPNRKIKAKLKQKPRPAVKKVQMPATPLPSPATLGFRARLKRLVRRR